MVQPSCVTKGQLFFSSSRIRSVITGSSVFSRTWMSPYFSRNSPVEMPSRFLMRMRSYGGSAMLTLLQHAVKHFTPLWQRNLSLLFAVSFMGMTLSLFLLLPNSNSSILDIPLFTDLDQGNRVAVNYVPPERDSLHIS